MNFRAVTLVACVLVASAGVATSCKSNRISQRNDGSYEAVETVTVDATGARVLGPDGAEVNIPPGALTGATDITIGKLRGGFPRLPEGWAPAGGVYSFEQHGQQFEKTVDIKVPSADAGPPLRLAVAQPETGWSAIDGAELKEGFAFTSSTHFSYYAVVTGAPPDPTIDAGVDAAVPPEKDAGPTGPTAPPRPMLFAAVPTQNVIYRFELSPTSIVDAGAPDAAPLLDGGAHSDGGAFTVPGPTAIALNAGPSHVLHTNTHAWELDGGGLLLDDAGMPVAIESGLAQLFDPFGTPALTGAFRLDNPGVMAFFNGELWLSRGAPPDIETFDGPTRTWFGAPAGMTTGTAGYGGIAYDPAAKTVFLSVRGPDAVQRWTVAGTGSAKNAVKALADLTSNLTAPSGLAFAPWGELLVINRGSDIARFDASGAPRGVYSAAALGVTPQSSLAVVRWAAGADEMFVVDAAKREIARFVFLDGDHNTLAKVASIATGSEVTSLVLAP